MHHLTEAPVHFGRNRCVCKPIAVRRPAPRHGRDQRRGPGGVLLVDWGRRRLLARGTGGLPFHLPHVLMEGGAYRTPRGPTKPRTT